MTAVCTQSAWLFDLHMPNLDGLSVVEELRHEGLLLPTILITGKLEDANTERARAFGLIAILEKPFRGAELVELVRAALRPPN